MRIAAAICTLALVAPAAAAAHGSGPVEQAICRAFPTDCRTALRVARCESQLRPSVVSRTNDHGLFQIHVSYGAGGRTLAGRFYSRSDLLTVDGNLRAARALWHDGGRAFYRHWRWSAHCWS